MSINYAKIRLPPLDKNTAVVINISSTFLPRVRCKACGEGPDFYFTTMMPFKWEDIKYFLRFSEISKKWIKQSMSDWYVKYEPRYFNQLSDFSFLMEARSYNPMLHKLRGINLSYMNNVREGLGCPCGQTLWYFNNKWAKSLPEITNRKGRYSYPQKFVY